MHGGYQRVGLEDVLQELELHAKKADIMNREYASRVAKHRNSTVGVEVKTLTGKTLRVPVGPECCVNDLILLIQDK